MSIVQQMTASHLSSRHLCSAHLRYGTSFPHRCYVVCVSSFPGASDVWFSLKGTTYQNNSIVILEDIGEGDNALLCMTNLTACCRPPYTGGTRKAIGNWYFPNGTRLHSGRVNGEEWDLYRTRGKMAIHMNRRRGGVEGIYHCEIPDAMNVTQTIYIGVYSASTGEWSILFQSYCVVHVMCCVSVRISQWYTQL